MAIYTTLDRETITGLSTAKGFTAAKLTKNVVYALVDVVDGPVRVCKQGTTPVANTTGIRFTKDSTFEVWSHKDLINFLAIDDGGTAKLEVEYVGTAD